MKRATFILFFIVLMTPLLFSQNAVVKQVSGKVEFKAPLKDWEPARVGTTIPKGSFLSTGFKSSAVLEMGSSSLSVNQLTRMTLEELATKEGVQQTEVFLRIGRVSAQVKTAEGIKHDFKLRSPVSTAAVRGTDFTYDGWTLRVVDGVVELIDPLNRPRLVIAGEKGYSDGLSLTTGEDAMSLDYRATAEERDLQNRFDTSGYRGNIIIKW